MSRVVAGSQDHAERAVTHRETRLPTEAIIVNIVYFFFGVIEVFLGLRFVLRLLGANPEAGFVRIVYAVSSPFMAPFEAVFPTQQVEGAVFDWSALLAIAVYALIAWGIAAFVRAASPRSSAGTVEQVESVERVGESEEHTRT